jgi:GNAT superfamily N-acetyltransferase
MPRPSGATTTGFVTRWRGVLAERPPENTLVAVVDEQVVGHAHLEPPILTSLYVEPRQWGRGVGRALLGAAEASLAQRGVTRGELWTIVGNERALTLYRSEGWVPDGTVEQHASSAGIVTTEMRLLKSLQVADG